MIKKQILHFNPYDNKAKALEGVPFNNDEERIKYFYEHFFYEYIPSEYETVIGDIKNALNTNIVFLYGPSGNGKTTLINNIFKEKDNKGTENYKKNFSDNYQFINIDLISKGSSASDYVFRDILEMMLKDDFIKSDVTLFQEYKNFFEKGRIFDRMNVNNALHSYIEHEIRFRNSPFYTENEDSGYFDEDIISNSNIDGFKKNYDLTDGHDEGRYRSALIKLLIINKLIKSNFNDTNKKTILIFDNLDELTQLYLFSDFFEIIALTYKETEDFLNIFYNKDFASVLRFVVVTRESNYSIIANQIKDRIKTFTSSSEIPYFTNQYSERIKKRREFLENQKDLGRFDVVSILAYDEILVKRLLFAMFNFDGRMLTEVVDNLEGIEPHDRYLCVNFDEYKAIHERTLGANGTSIGANGIMILSIFKYLYNKKSSSLFRNVINKDFEICPINGNPYRMALTILRSLSKIPDIGKDEYGNMLTEEGLFNSKIEPEYLSLLIKKIKELNNYDDDTILDIINSLCDVNLHNYEVFAYLFDSVEKNDIGSFKKIDEFIKEKIETEVKNPNSHKNKIRIKINPSGVIYSDIIFRHFEYFNLLSTIKDYSKSWNDDECKLNLKPLFLPKTIRREPEKLKEFFERVFKSTKDIVDKTDNSFCDTFCKQCPKKMYKLIPFNVLKDIEKNNNCKAAIDKFVEDGYTINNTIYTTRLISTQLDYIDSFRKYIIDAKIYEDCYKDVHEVILNALKELISLFFSKRIFDCNKKLKMKVIYSKLNKVKNTDIEYQSIL